MEIWVKIGPWKGKAKFLVSGECKQIIVGLPLLHQLGLSIDCNRDCLWDQKGHTMPCHPVETVSQGGKNSAL